MKIRYLLLTLAGLVSTYALPTFAQQTNTPDPQLRQQIVALLEKFTEAWNNNDAAALAATKDAVFVEEKAQDRITVARLSRNTLQLQRDSSYFNSATMLPRLISILLML
jgi:hypothetical protein